jgi:hypothetical protein
MTLKQNGFRALGVKNPYELTNSSQKAMKLNLAILSINPNFSHFDLNTQCLMRQEV